MRAAVYRGVDDIRIEHVPVPEALNGEVLVRVAWCGVCGTDIKKIHHGLVAPPRIFGHETSGTIVQVGAGVNRWKVGDRVVFFHHVPCGECHYCKRGSFAQCPVYKRTGATAGFEPAGGGFAEYVRVMPWIVDRGMVQIPDDVPFDEATFVEPVSTVWKAVEKANVAEGDTVLVIGQGQIGLLFTQLTQLRAARVIASDPLEYRRKTALHMGASHAVSPTESDLTEYTKQLTEGRGADLAVVAVARTEVVQDAFAAVRPGGKVLLFAQTHLDDPLTLDAGQVCMLEKDLIGSYSSDITLQSQSADLVFERQVNVRDLITHRLPLEEITRALEIAVSPRENSLKVLVHP